MYLYQRIFNAIRNWLHPRRGGNFTLDVETMRTLQLVAKAEDRTPDEMANQFLDEALLDLESQRDNWQYWQSLTPREQEVASLICLGYTSRQIAALLVISPETVKTHVEHILQKFEVSDRNQLRLKLSGWDFTGWGPPQVPRSNSR